MYKKSINPTIEELTKSHRDRQFGLGGLKAIKIDGIKKCIWCLEKLSGAQRKWCSEKCSNQAMAWGYPQQEHGLHVLLARQNFTCIGCGFSYMPYIDRAVAHMNRRHKTVDANKLYTDIYWVLMKHLKNIVPKINAPEVDHIIPISKGGQSIGLENLQILCFTCHKAKTKIDNSGPRKAKNVLE